MIHGLQPSLAEAGKIKIGGIGKEIMSKRGTKFRPPVKYDAFQITTTRRDREGNLIPNRVLMTALPKDEDNRIRSIPIVVHSNDIEDVFPTAYACYGGKKLECRGDGQTAMRWNSQRTEQKQVACPCPLLGASGAKTCKPHGTFHCSIALPGHAVAGAVYKWRTTSIISIQRMIGSLQQILATIGMLRGLPLRMKVEPVQVSPNDTTTTVYCCHVELDASDVMEVQRDAFEAQKIRKALAHGVDIDMAYKQLVAAPGLDESPQDQAEVAEEFHATEQPATTGSRAADLAQKLSHGQHDASTQGCQQESPPAGAPGSRSS